MAVSLASLPTDLDAPSGWTVHNVTDISQAGLTTCIYYGASPAVASGDQLLIATTTDTNAYAVTVDSQGLVTTSRGADDTIAWYHWDADTETWSAVQSYALAFVAGLSVTVDPPAGWQVHNVSDISQAGDEGCLYYGHSPAVASGDQILLATATTTNAWPITIDSQGFIEIDSGGAGGADSFGYYVFDETDDTWGTLGTFSLTAVASGGIGGGGSSHKAYSSKRLRKDVDDWLERERLRELAEQIRREDEELVVILTAIAA